MNPKDGERWKSETLDEILAALAASERLDEALIFKGARVLNIHLGLGRQSLDLDSNLSARFVQKHPDRQAQREFLEREITRAVRHHFERQEPVKYELTGVKVQTYPAKSDPMGWDAFKVKINVNDLTKHVKGLPALEIDVAAPEELLDTSIATIEVGGHHAHAYTLERIAGEKLRAFLSSLPTYRAKVRKQGEAVRARDLYDISRIHGVRGLGDVEFWRLVGKEFQIACRSRYVDCLGLETFQEQWGVTQKTYTEATIPKDISFEHAEAILVEVVRLLEAEGVVPFAFPLPHGWTQ